MELDLACPNCGGKREYRQESDSLYCPYCGSTFIKYTPNPQTIIHQVESESGWFIFKLDLGLHIGSMNVLDNLAIGIYRNDTCIGILSKTDPQYELHLNEETVLNFLWVRKDNSKPLALDNSTYAPSAFKLKPMHSKQSLFVTSTIEKIKWHKRLKISLQG